MTRTWNHHSVCNGDERHRERALLSFVSLVGRACEVDRGPISRKKKKKKKPPERIGGGGRKGPGEEWKWAFALGGGLLEEIRGEKLGTEKWRRGGPASKGKWWQEKRGGENRFLNSPLCLLGKNLAPIPPVRNARRSLVERPLWASSLVLLLTNELGATVIGSQTTPQSLSYEARMPDTLPCMPQKYWLPSTTYLVKFLMKREPFSPGLVSSMNPSPTHHLTALLLACDLKVRQRGG